ncbi:putative F-box/FBD/LRR-repeat protein [Rosa sericea]
MVRKYKLRPRPTARVDRFSILPDEVAHHILSFLKFIDLVRVSTVSKTCRRFYLSIPSLEINRYNLYARRDQEEVQLLNFLDRYFFNRGDNRIQHFHIHWSFNWKPSNKQIQVTDWIHKAVRCNVEVLDIDFCALPPLFVMPSSVFVSQSLRSLSVHLHGVILQAPSSSLLCNLHYLKLSEIKIVDECFFKWISCSCKCIKELQLDQIRGLPKITIESSSLKLFKVWSKDLFHLNIFGDKIEDIHITWRKFYPPPSRKWLNISAPNLKNLKWEGNLMNIQNLGILMSLEKAVVFLESAVNEFDNVSKVICSISRAKVVILNEWTIKALLREYIIPTSLDDLCCFGVELKNLNDDLVPAVVSLLREMPNLNTLQIQCSPRSSVANSRCSGIDMGFWKLQNLAFIYQLKEAKLWLSNGSNGIELAKYILEHAQNLEKMVIFHLFKDSDVVRELKSKMISNATVVCHVRKDERATSLRFIH